MASRNAACSGRWRSRLPPSAPRTPSAEGANAGGSQVSGSIDRTLRAMTVPLWCLLGFVAWTMLIVGAIGVYRVGSIVFGRARGTDFPSGVPHGPDMYWRLNRAHANATENVPLF